MPKKTNDKITVTDFYGNPSQVPLSKLQWRPSAYGIVVKDNKLLLLRQINGYDLPGGGINIGETPEAAVVREVKEETGLNVTRPCILGVGSSFFLAFRPNGAYYQAVMIYYACDSVDGELSTDGFDEGEQQYAEAPEWVPLEKLDLIKIGSSNDFRPYVKQVLNI